MILDYNTQFNDGTTAASLSVVTTSADSAILDMMTANWNGGAGTPVWVISQVNTTFTCGSQFYVEFRSGAASTTVTTSHFSGKSMSVLECTKGAYLLAIPLPAGCNIGRFVKLTYHCSGSANVAGAIDSYLSFNAPRF
jgi:hypothetical protein